MWYDAVNAKLVSPAIAFAKFWCDSSTFAPIRTWTSVSPIVEGTNGSVRKTRAAVRTPSVTVIVLPSDGLPLSRSCPDSGVPCRPTVPSWIGTMSNVCGRGKRRGDGTDMKATPMKG